MSEFLEKFGKKVKEYWKLKHLSQEQLAELINVSTNTISVLERGKTFIQYKNLTAICKVLEIKEVDLFDFSMGSKKTDKISEKINIKVKELSVPQQMQVLEIVNTFKSR